MGGAPSFLVVRKLSCFHGCCIGHDEEEEERGAIEIFTILRRGAPSVRLFRALCKAVSRQGSKTQWNRVGVTPTPGKRELILLAIFGRGKE